MLALAAFGDTTDKRVCWATDFGDFVLRDLRLAMVNPCSNVMRWIEPAEL